MAPDIMNGVPEELPPMCGVNHHILLIDENKRYHYHLPQCPDSMKVQLMEKITLYVGRMVGVGANRPSSTYAVHSEEIRIVAYSD
jgi:hypothetical protein